MNFSGSISNIVISLLTMSVLICFAVPIGGFIFFQIKKKRMWKPFLLGALAFTISQLLLRIPILSLVLSGMEWFINMQINHPVWYSIFLGLTAGIFEETARVIFITLAMDKNQRFEDGIVFGLGHGGIEAILLVGMSLINTIVVCLMINQGTFGMLGATMTPEVANAAYQQCIELGTLDACLSGIERLFAITMHIGFTMIIMSGVRKKKTGLYYMVAVLVHGAVDSMIGILPLVFGTSVIIVEVILGIIAAGAAVYIMWTKKNIVWQEEGVREKA